MKILVIALVIIIPAIFLILLFIDQMKEYRYKQDYIYLEDLIDKSEVTGKNFDIILKEFHKLDRYKFNDEATLRLFKTFMNKYQLYHPNTY